MAVAEKMFAAGYLKNRHRVTERKACESLRLPRSVYRYKPTKKDDEEFARKLENLLKDASELGFWKVFQILKK